MSDPLSLYLHWPFCARKCPYCDYNSHVRAQVDQAQWQQAFLAEIDHWAARTEGRPVTTVFFGGGTPSLMPVGTLAAILERIGQRWQLATDCEITLEANPTHLETGQFAAFRACGVNRLSLGVQALDDAALRFLGREHSAAAALAAIEGAAKVFSRWSFDLIWGRPGQTLGQWQHELGHALSLGSRHLSLYQLSIEENTGFYQQWRAGNLQLPDDGMLAELDHLTGHLCRDAGLERYEISSFAVPGQECRHNLAYWCGKDYLGIGPGAHGRITLAGQRHATETHRSPERWLREVREQGHGLKQATPLDLQAQVEELLLLGLRVAEGIPASRYEQASGQTVLGLLQHPAARRLIGDGLLHDRTDRLKPTSKGLLFLNRVEAGLVEAASIPRPIDS